MPAQAIGGIAYGGSDARLGEVQSPVWVSFDAAGAGWAGLWLGPASLVAGVAGGAASASAGLNVGLPVAGDANGGSEAVVGGLTIPAPLAGMAAGGAVVVADALSSPWGVVVAAAGQSSLAGNLRAEQRVSGAAVGGSDAAAGFAADLRWPMAPRSGDEPGTLNLVRNPSLERFGLTDWASEGDGALADGDDPEAWDGGRVAGFGVPVGGAGTLVVASQRGLNLGGDALWIGSLSVAGDGGDIVLTLRLVYADGTSEDGEGRTATTGVGWGRYATDAVRQNPAKVLERIDLRVDVAGGALGRDLLIDAAQIEMDMGLRETPFASGDNPDGWHAWTGVPGLSPSVRQPRPALATEGA